MPKKYLLLILVLVLLLGVGVSASSAQAVDELTIWWAQWAPADYLQQIGNDYEAATGIKVNVVQTPWGDFYTRVGTEWAAKGTSYDLIVGDSQWVGQGVTQGHYVDLTDFMVSNGIDKTVTPATLKYYGEYPQGIGQLLGLPDRRRCQRFCLSQGPVREPGRTWRPSRPNMVIRSGSAGNMGSTA